MGRPRQAVKRSVVVATRLLPGEADALDTLRKGLSRSQYLALLLNAERKRSLSEPAHDPTTPDS